jgi:hypothetical protein
MNKRRGTQLGDIMKGLYSIIGLLIALRIELRIELLINLRISWLITAITVITVKKDTALFWFKA